MYSRDYRYLPLIAPSCWYVPYLHQSVHVAEILVFPISGMDLGFETHWRRDSVYESYFNGAPLHRAHVHPSTAPIHWNTIETDVNPQPSIYVRVYMYIKVQTRYRTALLVFPNRI